MHLARTNSVDHLLIVSVLGGISEVSVVETANICKNKSTPGELHGGRNYQRLLVTKSDN